MTHSKVITQQDKLISFLEKIKDSPFITVDTEFMRERTYYPELCLIQVSDADGNDAAIDPIEGAKQGLDLEPLFALLDNPDQRVVLHAARQDLEIFYYLSGRLPKNLFDTQIAAAFLGLGEQVAYKSLVQKYCHAEMSKAQQFTDWSKRPLNDDQLEYALSDVTYLVEIYKSLHKELESENRLSWINSEMETLTDISAYDVNPDDAWERVKIRSSKGRDLIVLKILAKWREEEAKRRNVPRGYVVKDDALAQMAMICPKNSAALGDIRFFSASRAEGRDGKQILSLVKDALAIPKAQWPQKPQKTPLSADQSAALEMLKMLIKVISAEAHISPKMLASNIDLEDIVKDKQDAKIPAMRGWRYELFGKEALALLTGRLALSYKEGQIIRHQLS